MPRKSTPPPNTACVRCGAPFYAKPYQLRAGRGRYCGVPCHNATQNERLRAARPPVVQRFWEKVSATSAHGCWVWEYATNGVGYGRFWDGTRLLYAHRFAYIERFGAIPDGLELDHLCRNRRCVNPAHLEPVTRSENLLRSPLIGQHSRMLTECVHGHPFSEENTAYTPQGHRRCRQCERDARKRYYYANRELEYSRWKEWDRRRRQRFDTARDAAGLPEVQPRLR